MAGEMFLNCPGIFPTGVGMKRAVRAGKEKDRRCFEEKPAGPYPLLTLHLHPGGNGPVLYWRFSYPESTPCASMLFKTKHCPFSQAGRHGFESRLPLQNQ
jgi:hypothetical protein